MRLSFFFNEILYNLLLFYNNLHNITQSVCSEHITSATLHNILKLRTGMFGSANDSTSFLRIKCFSSKPIILGERGGVWVCGVRFAGLGLRDWVCNRATWRSKVDTHFTTMITGDAYGYNVR